jgi:hypothetical protein
MAAGSTRWCTGVGPLAPGEDAVYQWMTVVARAHQDPAAAFRTEISRAAAG